MSQSKKRRLPDPAEMAFSVIQRISGESQPEPIRLVDVKKSKAGKIGGKKGGKARAESISADRRTAIAKKAAISRWKTAKTR